VLMRLRSDLLDVLEAAVDERLDAVALEWDPRPAATVVMAAEGYPGHYEREREIQNLDAVERMPDVKVFHAGTTLRVEPGPGREARIVSDGGRVLNVTALGDTLEDARTRAYEAARTIKFPGAWYRRDIAGRSPRVGR
jgi:phosphoribosylamine---glycine ligase